MEKLAVSINDAAKALGLGRTTIYAMIADGAAGGVQAGAAHADEGGVDPPAGGRTAEACAMSARRVSPNAIKLHYSYSVGELATAWTFTRTVQTAAGGLRPRGGRY